MLFKNNTKAGFELFSSLYIAVLGAVLLLGSTGSRAADSGSPDPLQLYGPSIEFDVYRNGSRVGFHKTEFQKIPDGQSPALSVRSHFSLEIDFLVFTAYRFEYISQALWRDGKPQRMDITVNDDGDRLNFAALWHDDALIVNNGAQAQSWPAPLFPTNHWNSGVLGSDYVFNTLTGNRNQVILTSAGWETISTGQGPREAERWVYTGELEAEVWYDRKGRWVKLQFAGKDGSKITYRCIRCASPESLAQSEHQQLIHK